MVPVCMLQEGCTVTDAVGLTAVKGAALTVTELVLDMQVEVVFRTLIK